MAGNSLTEVVYDGQFHERHERVQKTFADEVFRQPDGLSLPQRASNAYRMLRHAAGQLGRTREVVRDPHLLFAFYDWASTHAPDLIPLVSGHYNLTAGTLLTLGADRADLEPYLAELDAAASVGVLLINEHACGSNVASLETTATFDAGTATFILRTPNPGARKCMPNVADAIPRTTILVARLVVAGVDRGIFPFVVRLRDDTGAPAPGVTIARLPDKPFLPMDNAVISFDGARVGFGSWLSAGTAEIDDYGEFRFINGAGPHEVFRRTMSQFTFGRTALSSGVVAAARAATLVLARHVQSREIRAFRRHRLPMLELSNVRRSLFGSLARTYACTFFANTAKRAVAESDDLADPGVQLLGMLAKAFLITSCREIIQECRDRCGAPGMFSANRIPDYLGLAQAGVTAEGDAQVMRLTAGRQLALEALREPLDAPAARQLDSLDDQGSWLELFTAHEHRFQRRAVLQLRGPLAEGKSTFDRWNASMHDAMELADAHANRLALEAFLAEIDAVDDTEARTALRSTAKLYVLEHLIDHAGSYLAEGRITPEMFDRLDADHAATCDQLAPHLPLLVDAFAIDESILDAPATSPDGWDRLVARR